METSSNRNNSNKTTPFAARNEIFATEAKVVSGIQLIYKLINGLDFKRNHIIESDDVQGIDTIYLTEKELLGFGLAEYFPNQGKNGITVHVHKPGSIPYPPTLYMLKQKLKSFSMSAGLSKPEFIQLWQEVLKSYENKMDQVAHERANAMTEEKMDDSIVKSFNTNSLELMDELTKKMMINMYEMKVPAYQQSEEDFKQYCENIFATSIRYRTSHASILTFNETAKVFSFDEVYSTTTAHQRGLLDKTANLSIAYEGTYRDENFKMTHSIIKHASLAPIDALAGTRLADLFEENVDVMVSTCNHVEEVAKVMATYRKHGRKKGDNTPLELEWTYQLLTTNAFNDEKQATAYGYIVKASNLMSGITIDNAKLSMHVINAGVNDWAEYNFGQHTDMQNRENISAYLNLGKNFKNHIHLIQPQSDESDASFVRTFNNLVRYYEPVDPLLGLNAKFDAQLYNLYSESASEREIANLKKDYEDKLTTLQSLINLKYQYENDLSNIARSFNESRLLYNKYLNAHMDTMRDTETIKKQVGQEGLDHILEDLRKNFENEKTKMLKYMKESGTISTKLEKINKRLFSHSQEYWDINKTPIQQMVGELIKDSALNILALDLDDPDPKIRENATERFLSIAAVVYKSYMDELFYSNRYREPKNGALFNAYLASYLRISGLIASMGCKSANDRTYVVRLFISLLNNADKRARPLPSSLHRDLESYKNFSNDLSKIANSNSGLYSCIADTAGGTPKVDAKKFKYLDFMEGVNYIGQFGKYAAHKLYETIVNIARKVKDKVSDNKFVVAYKTHRKAMRFKSSQVDPLIAANDNFIHGEHHGKEEDKQEEKKKINYEKDTKYKFNE